MRSHSNMPRMLPLSVGTFMMLTAAFVVHLEADLVAGAENLLKPRHHLPADGGPRDMGALDVVTEEVIECHNIEEQDRVEIQVPNNGSEAPAGQISVGDASTALSISRIARVHPGITSWCFMCPSGLAILFCPVAALGSSDCNGTSLVVNDEVEYCGEGQIAESFLKRISLRLKVAEDQLTITPDHRYVPTILSCAVSCLGAPDYMKHMLQRPDASHPPITHPPHPPLNSQDEQTDNVSIASPDELPISGTEDAASSSTDESSTPMLISSTEETAATRATITTLTATEETSSDEVSTRDEPSTTLETIRTPDATQGSDASGEDDGEISTTMVTSTFTSDDEEVQLKEEDPLRGDEMNTVMDPEEVTTMLTPSTETIADEEGVREETDGSSPIPEDMLPNTPTAYPVEDQTLAAETTVAPDDDSGPETTTTAAALDEKTLQTVDTTAASQYGNADTASTDAATTSAETSPSTEPIDIADTEASSIHEEEEEEPTMTNPVTSSTDDTPQGRIDDSILAGETPPEEPSSADEPEPAMNEETTTAIITEGDVEDEGSVTTETNDDDQSSSPSTQQSTESTTTALTSEASNDDENETDGPTELPTTAPTSTTTEEPTSEETSTASSEEETPTTVPLVPEESTSSNDTDSISESVGEAITTVETTTAAAVTTTTSALPPGSCGKVDFIFATPIFPFIFRFTNPEMDIQCFATLISPGRIVTSLRCLLSPSGYPSLPDTIIGGAMTTSDVLETSQVSKVVFVPGSRLAIIDLSPSTTANWPICTFKKEIRVMRKRRVSYKVIGWPLSGGVAAIDIVVGVRKTMRTHHWVQKRRHLAFFITAPEGCFFIPEGAAVVQVNREGVMSLIGVTTMPFHGCLHQGIRMPHPAVAFDAFITSEWTHAVPLRARRMRKNPIRTAARSRNTGRRFPG